MGPPSRSKDLPLQNCSAMPSPRATLLSIAALLANARYIICPASAFLQPIASRHGGDRTVLVPTMIPAGRTAGSCKNRQNAGVTIMSATTALDKRTSTDTYEVLRGCRVKRVSSGDEISLVDAWVASPGKKTIVAFFTHTADFNSWEYAQKLRHYLPQIDDAGIGVVGVSLGTVDAARDFCAETGFPLDNMFMDEEGAAYQALGFSNGFEPRLPGGKKLNPYLRLLPMLAGIGSPGTIQAVLKVYAGDTSSNADQMSGAMAKVVLRGYVGDPNANTDWISSAMTIVDNKEFEILGKGGARPLELATLRLQNMRQIVTKWNKLAPPNKELITQQGGTVVFQGRELIYNFKDKGILVYTDVLGMLQEIGVDI